MTSKRMLAVAAGVAAVVTLAFLGTGGSAASRLATVTFLPDPGPVLVTVGENVAYKSTFRNDSQSTFTHVRFHMPIPRTSAGAATLRYASCAGTLAAGEYRCDFDNLGPGESAPTVRLVWRAPAAGGTSSPIPTSPLTDAPTVSCPAGTDCLLATAYWTTKEGQNDTQPQASATDTFTCDQTATPSTCKNDVGLLLLADTTRARGYRLPDSAAASCQGGRLETSQALDVAGNPVSTSICLPTFTGGTVVDPGLLSKILEGPNTTGVGFATVQQSDICIPAFGLDCAAAAPQPFASQSLVFTLRVLDGALPKGAKIEHVFHEGAVVPACPAAGPECATITYSSRTKTWTVVARAATNGRWSF